MKKIIDFIISTLLAIVYPDRILNLFRVRNLDQNSNKFLGNDNVVKIFALILALVFVIASRHETEAQEQATRTLPNVPLTQVLNENYTHVGDPIVSHIEVILSGDQTELDIFQAGGGFGPIRAYLDLDELELNVEHNNVLIRIEGAEELGFTPTANPSTISSVRIVEKEEDDFPVEAAPRNREILDSLEQPSSRYRHRIYIEPNYATIRGAEERLNEIEEVRALFNAIEIDVESPYFETEAHLVALDALSDRISDVVIIPETVNVRVVIYEDLRPINIVFNETVLNMPRDYETIDVTININEIQVWGDFSDMEDPYELPRINFRDLDDEGQITFPIELPNGVYSEIDEEVLLEM